VVIDFLNNNHIQGYSKSKIKMGLFYEDELVSLMTFGDIRIFMGSKDQEKNNYELIRFCNEKGVNVIGGASRLFKNFLRNYKPNKVISYSDNSYSDGRLYKTLGFDISESKVHLNYHWVINKKREHRYKYRKSVLVKMGYDSNKSEKDIMYEDVGAYRVWGCGNKKWLYVNKL
jgi:hypothetical protein